VPEVRENPRPDAEAVIASPPVERVAIVGCGGSGKSYVARQLGRLLDLPVVHMDTVYFDDQWNPLPMERFEAAQRELVAAPRWVIDGNYNSTVQVRLEAADTVVFMDLPTRVCLWGILSRQLRHGRGQNNQDGVYNRITPDVLRYVLSYRRKMRPRILAKIDQYASDTQVIVLTSRRQTRRFLRQVASSAVLFRPEPTVAERAPTEAPVEFKAGHEDCYGAHL
jgi:adenylate kinase family enzyme